MLRKINSLKHILFFINLIINIDKNKGFVFQDGKIETHKPCSNGILLMERKIGGLPSKEFYWTGILKLNRVYPNLSEARISIKLSAKANVSVDPYEGRILSNQGFHITYYTKDFEDLKFEVQGYPNESFPNLIELQLNNADVCPQPKRWNPTLYGSNFSEASLSNLGVKFNNYSCGRNKQFVELVIFGIPTIEKKWPWHAALFHRNSDNNFEYKCGGTLINEKTVLTAGHCISQGSRFLIPERVLIKLGLFHKEKHSKNTQESLVDKIISHPSFDATNLENDIALLKLSNKMEFNSYVQPICLWVDSEKNIENILSEDGIVVGWGLTEEKKSSDILLEAKMPVVTPLTCLNSNRNFFSSVLNENTYCAGFRNGTSVCTGDSGGGMYFNRGNVWKIRGIVSLSYAKENIMCNSEEFVIFTDVAKYLTWIDKNF